MALGPQNPPPPNFAEDFEKFRKSRSIGGGPDPSRPLAYDPAKGTYRDPSTAPEAYGRLITTPRTKAAEPFVPPPPPPGELPTAGGLPTGGLLGPDAPEAPKELITPKLDSGYSDPLTIGELKGRFNFDRPFEPAGNPVTGGTPAPRYAFETEDGGLWYLQLEKEYQGGRWEEAEHAEADYQRYKEMDPAFRRATLLAMWGPKSRVAVLIDQQATAKRPFSDLKSVLTPFNTQRQISFGEPSALGAAPGRRSVRDATAQAQVEAQATTPTDISGGTIRGLLHGPAALLKNLPIAFRQAGPSMMEYIHPEREPVPVEETPSYQAGQWIQEYSDKNYPVPKDRETNFLENLASGFGQMTNYLVGGVVAKQIQVSRWLVPIIFGQSAVSLYEQSKEAGMSDEAAYNSYLIGLGLDASEAAPIARIFGRVNKSTGGGLRKVILDIAKSAGEEATQEFLQESAQRKIEVERIEGGLAPGETSWGYFSQAVEAAEIGGIIGATMNILGMAAGLPSMSRTQRREARAKMDKATEDLNKKLDNKGEIQPPRAFKIDDQRIMGVFGTAPQKPNRVVLEDGTVVRRGENFIESLQQYGYQLLSQKQIDSLKPGVKPLDVVAKELEDEVATRLEAIDTEIAALEASLDLEASAAQETERQAKIERLKEQKRALTVEEFPERVGMAPEPGPPEAGPDIERIRKGVQPKPPPVDATGEPIFPQDAADAARKRLQAKRDIVEGAPPPPTDPPAGAMRVKAEEEAQIEREREKIAKEEADLAAAADAVMTPLPADVAEEATQDEPLNPKVEPLIHALNSVGVRTMLSGDLYGDEVIYVDIDQASSEKIGRKLPEGWDLLPRDASAVDKWLGKELTPFQEEQLAKVQEGVEGARLVRKGSEPVSIEDISELMSIFTQKAEEAGRRAETPDRPGAFGKAWGIDEAPAPPSDLISPEEAKKAAAETPELKAAKQNLLDNAARLRAEAQADVEDARDRVTARREAAKKLKKGDAAELSRGISVFPVTIEKIIRTQAGDPVRADVRMEDGTIEENVLLENLTVSPVLMELSEPSEETEKLAAATAELKKYTRDLGDKEALFGMAYRKWRLGGEFSVRADDPAVLKSVFEWAQENADSEQNIRSKIDGIVTRHKVGREGSIGDIRRAFYRLTAKWRKAEEEGKVARPEAEQPEEFANFSSFMDEQDPGFTFLLSRKDVPEISQVDKTPLDFDQWWGTWKRVDDPKGPIRWRNPMTGVEMLSRGFAVIGPVRMGEAIAQSKRLKAAAEEKPEIPDLGQADDFSAKMNRYPEGTKFTITADDTKHIPDLLHGLPLAKQLVGEWEKVLLTPGSGSTGVWKKTAGTPLPTVGPVPSAFFVDALDEDGMSSVLKRNTLMGLIAGKFIYDAPLKPSKAKEPVVTPQIAGLPGMTPLGLPEDPEQLQKEMEAEDVTEAEKPVGPAPGRTLRIGRGANGQVVVVFNRKDDADLFAAVGRMRRKMQKKGGPEGPGWPRLRELYPEGAGNIALFSQDYRDQIMEAIKGLPEGETFQAPRPTGFSVAPVRTQLEGTEAPPPPTEEHPSVQKMDDYVAQLVIDRPNDVGYAWQYYAIRKLGGLMDDMENPKNQAIRDTIDDFFPDVDVENQIWDAGDKAIWQGKEVELAMIHDYVRNQVTKVVIREAADVSKVHTVFMSEIRHPDAPIAPQDVFDPDDPMASWPKADREAASAELELSWAQRVVLAATATWKNTYAGQKNVRFTEANKEVGITEADWEEAKAQLMRDKYLRKNNSISPKGKQAEILPGKTTSEAMSVFMLGRKPVAKAEVAPGGLVKPAYTNKDGQADFALRKAYGDTGQPLERGTPAHRRWVTPQGEQVTLDSVNFRDGVRGSAGQLEGATEVGAIRWPVSHDTANKHDQEAIDHYGLKPFVEAERGSENTIFTKDKADEARERLRKKARGDQLNVGFDPQDMADMFALGGFHFEALARTGGAKAVDFAGWSKKMIDEVGEWVRPMLEGQFNMIKQSYEAEAAKTAKATLPEPPKEPTIEGGVPTDAGTQRPIQDPEVDGPDALEAAPPQDVGQPQEGGEGGRAPGQPGELGDPGDRLAGEERPAAPGPDPGDRAPDVHIPPGRVATNPNFYRAKPDEIGLGTKLTKARNNVAALELLQQLQESGDIPTPEQLDALNLFTGWGQLKKIFDQFPTGAERAAWKPLSSKVRELLSDGEYKAARRSTLNAHYTSPELVKFMWEAVQKMGFEGGKVLEPSMGIGNFLGLAPDSVVANSKFVGVELDNMTGSMAKMLYPGADIFVKGFEEVFLPNESFDLVISNVPFGNYKVYDPSYKHDNIKSIHDYFIIKSLDKAKPGGLVVVITSMYTMDKKTSRMREMMASRADLVEAFRLPNNAFAKNAGTQVTTDLLIFRKRAATETRGGQSFVDLAPYVARGAKDAPEGTINTKTLNINEYFKNNPRKMLGTMSARGTMYGGKDEATLDPEGDLTELLVTAMKAVPEGVFGATATAPDEELAQTLRMAPDDVKEGAFTIDAKGQIKQRVRGILVDPDVLIPKRIKKKRTWIKQNSSQIKQLINLREQVKAVLRVQLATDDDAMVEGEQKKLNRLYDQYKDEFGLLHDDSSRELFSPDPQYPLLLALETYDPESETATKADIFNKRTLFPNRPLESVSTDPQESLLQVLGQTGRADIDLITTLSEKPREQIVSELEELNLIFENPETGQHEIAEQYLSEYVKDKLEIAERAAASDPRFQRNVDALKEVQPETIPINGPDLKKLILVRLGSSWIPPATIKDFVRHLDDSPGKITVTYGRPTTRKGTKVKVGGVPKKWIVKFPDRASVANTRRWSGGGMTAQKLLTIALNLGTPKVVVRTSSGTSLDPEATLAAKAKMQEIKNEFEKWARTEPKWGPRLEKSYNEAMNKIRNRSFDGAHMTYPGMNAAITMQPHQNNGVWRMIAAGRALLAHPVGSGKTFEMIAAAMEMRRMGMVKKSLFAVPNHLVEYWHNEFQRLYPGANVLSPNEDDFTPPKRQQFFSRIATGDWDAVIIAQSHIEMIPVSKDREIRLLRAELNEATEALEAGRREGDRHFIRRMENTLAALEAKLKALIDRPRDDTILFEDMGIDMLFVDEAHNYKNLFFYTKMGTVSGLGQSPSGRATAMKLKTDYLLEKNNNRGVVFATATPISNTMAEMYTMTRFLAPDVYVAAGITNFDEWAANFGETVEVSELSPDAQSYHQRTKFSRFNNMPEMINQFRFYADVLEVEGLGLNIPPLRGGRPMPVKVPSHELLDDLFRYIVNRAERLRGGGVDKREDNWLKLTHDAKLISLDARMYSGPGAKWIDHPDSKVNHAVEQIYQRWENSKSLKGTQMVFIDNFQNTLKDAETKKVTRVLINLYDDMTEKLIARGVPAEDIAKIHDFEGSKEKQRAFDKMNAGKIRILFGTRMKMGEGTNAQERMVALHNLDQPWKPSQYDQGNGRILRQGNRLYDEGLIDSVEIPQYLTEKSFDAYMFQALETKAKFIHAAMSGQVLDRTMLDVAADVVLNYSELKALASGNPDVKVQLDLSIEASRLQTLQNEHFWERHRSKNQIDGKRYHIRDKTNEVRLLSKAQEIWAESDDGAIFSAVINGIAFDDVKKASSYIQDNPEGAPSISLYGYDLKITRPESHKEGGVPIRPEGPIGSYKVEDLFYYPQYVFAGHREISPATEEGLVTPGIIQSIKIRGGNLKDDIKREEVALVRLEKDIVDLQELSVEEFAYATELEEVTAKLEAVEIRLGMRPDPDDESASPDGESEDGDVTVRDETDQPPETPDVGGIEMAEAAPAPPTEATGRERQREKMEQEGEYDEAPAPPREEQTIRIKIGEDMVPTPALKVAPGLFVHINPAKEEGVEEEEGRQWSVTHGPSGQAIENESATESIAVRLAEKLAAIGDWMRSSAELAADSEFAKAVQKLLKDERGFIRLDFWNPKKQAIDKAEIKSPDPMVQDALTARARPGKTLWEGMKGFPREVHRTWGAEFFYEFKVLKWPRFVEALRRFADAPLDLALEATEEIRTIVKPLDYSQFQVFEKIVVGKDIRENLRREPPIPQGDLTFEQIDEEIGRLERLADPLIMDRVQAHDEMMEGVGDDLIERGKMKESDRKAHYFTNRVIDHFNKLDKIIVGLPKNLKTPHRWYTKQRKGSQAWHESDYLKITHRYLMKVKMDNATDDFVDDQAQNLDAMKFLSPEERTELFGPYGRPTPKRIYTLPDGQDYKGWQYKEGNTLYHGKTANEEMILDAIAEGLTVEEWQELEGAQTDVTIQGGKYKTYLLPIEVADRLTEFRGSTRSIWARAFVPYMGLWKRVTLDFAGLPFQTMNLLGDDINLYFEDIPALFKQVQAIRMLYTGGQGKEKGSRLGELAITATGRSRFTGEFEGLTEQDIMEMARDARTISSSALWFEAHQMNPYKDPELSHLTGKKGKIARWLLPFPGANIIERGSAFRESVPRLAKFLKDAERVDRGEKVVVKSTSIEGLTPIEAMGKASRNFTVDYGAVSPMFRDEVRGWMFPFATFYLKNFSNYKYRTHHHFLETTMKAGIPFGALMLWNYTMFPEVEDELSEWWKYMPHLNTGYKTEDGKDIIIAFSTPVEMAAAMIGLDRLPDRLFQLNQGKITYKEAAEGQLKDTLYGFPRTMIDLINPFAKAIQGVNSNKDPWSGRQIVPDELWGDRSEIWPQTDAGSNIMAEFIMRTLLSPYAQYVRTSRLQEPGEGIYKFLVEGPLDVYRAAGYREVDLSAGERAQWWEARGIVLASVAEKLYNIEDAYLAWRRGELTNKQYTARRKEILTRGGPGPSDRELYALERSRRVKILVLQDELRAETDTKKRQAIVLEMDEHRYQQQLQAYRQTKRSARPDVDIPERIPRFFAPGTEAPAPPP